MKVNLWGVLLAFFTVLGCKPARVVTENRAAMSNNEAVWMQRDSVLLKERQIANLSRELQGMREEMMDLRQEQLQLVVEYDTGQPIDSISGRPPVRSERVIVGLTSLSRMRVDAEQWLSKLHEARERTARAEGSMELTAKSRATGMSEVKQQAGSPTPPGRKLFTAGMVVIIMGLLYVLVHKTWVR